MNNCIKYLFFSGACPIQLENKVILTGGVIDSVESTTVSVYDRNGWIGNLPNLQTVRRNHGCGHYRDDNDNIVSVSKLF